MDRANRSPGRTDRNLLRQPPGTSDPTPEADFSALRAVLGAGPPERSRDMPAPEDVGPAGLAAGRAMAGPGGAPADPADLAYLLDHDPELAQALAQLARQKVLAGAAGAAGPSAPATSRDPLDPAGHGALLALLQAAEQTRGRP
jgi:hypothetical protein